MTLNYLYRPGGLAAGLCILAALFGLLHGPTFAQPTVSIHTDKPSYRGGENVETDVSVRNPDRGFNASIYVGLIPSERSLFMFAGGRFTESILPWVENVYLPSGLNVEHISVCSIGLPSDVPPIDEPGEVTIFAAITHVGQLELPGQLSFITFSYLGTGQDIYVDAERGSDGNDGSAELPFKTITHALATASPTETEPITVHVAASIYSASHSGESFPLNMKSWVSLIGEGANRTLLDAESSSTVVNVGAVQNAAVEGFTITGGKATNGGGVTCSASFVTFADNRITENTADMGAGIYCLGGSPVFRDNIIVGNTATGRLGYGGAMFIINASPSLTGNTISQNFGDSIGCIYLDQSSPIIENNTIAGNVATGEWALAGAIYAQGGSLIIKGNAIVDNAATSGSGLVGGVHLLMASGSLEGNEFSGNWVTGDDALAGGLYCHQSSPAIFGNTFSDNTSTGVGALYCLEASPDITANLFTTNSGLVGAICAAEGSQPIITNNVLAGNYGFGIACFPRSSSTIVNNLIVKGEASYGGASGIWCWGCTGLISNCTIVGNDGSGIRCYREHPVIQNSIVWDNGDDLWNCRATYCCLPDPSDHGAGNIFEDPRFVKGPLGDYYLDPMSSCIDAGNVSAEDAGLSDFTTQADGSLDTGQVDLGCHYPVE
ncbi:MAG TPA: right-handed parallel beta-helix repeat-containing protein [bacterium]|nr:right-handed parallel beta-helix repeat-containing protein [bacterium]